MINQVFNRAISWSSRAFRAIRLPLPAINAFAVGLSLTFVVAACSGNQPTASNNNPSVSPASTTAAKGDVVRFGYQKSTILVRTKGVIEKRLNPEGVQVEWKEFPAGHPYWKL